jgi:hypothetical protein
MMKSPSLYVGASEKVIVWRFRKPGAIEFVALEKGTSGFFTKGRDGELMHQGRPEIEDTLLVVYRIVNAEDPAAALEQSRQSGQIVAKAMKLTAGARIFDDEWLNLVQPPAEQQLYAAAPTEMTTLEF